MDTIVYPKSIKANKQHKCMWCCQPIEKGSKYLKSVHVDSGDIWTWKTHQYCSDIADKIGMYDDGEGVGEEAFHEYITNEYSKISGIHDYRNYPKFAERLMLVLDFHKISTSHTGALAVFICY